MGTFLQSFHHEMESIRLMLIIITAILHLIFSGAVARDTGQMQKIGRRPVLVNGFVWAFATLVGGVMVFFMYWFIHYSTFSVRKSD